MSIQSGSTHLDGGGVDGTTTTQSEDLEVILDGGGVGLGHDDCCCKD